MTYIYIYIDRPVPAGTVTYAGSMGRPTYVYGQKVPTHNLSVCRARTHTLSLSLSLSTHSHTTRADAQTHEYTRRGLKLHLHVATKELTLKPMHERVRLSTHVGTGLCFGTKVVMERSACLPIA